MDKPKKDITITSNLGAVLPTGPFQNIRQELNWSVTYRDVDALFDPRTAIDADLDEIEECARRAAKRQFAQLELTEKFAKQKLIAKQYDNIRWYPVSDTESYPSVTSVMSAISPVKFHVSKERLNALAARGTIIDFVLQKFHETSEWLEPKQIPECHPYLFKLKAFNDSLGDPTKAVKIEGDLPAFIDKYGIKIVKGHRNVINRKWKYGGEPDGDCIYEGKRYLFDLKSFYSGPEDERTTRALIQMSAYAMAEEEWDIGEYVPITDKYDGIMMWKIHGGNQQGYSKPTIKTDIPAFFSMFCEMRRKFTEVFDV